MLTPGVDSYATLAELAARASAYGGALPEDDAGREVLLRRAAEAMNAWPWRGRCVWPTQPLAWPRSGVPGVADDAVPLAVRAAQCALAIEIHADDVSPPERRTGAVVRERVDVLEVEYAEAAPVPRAAPVRASRALVGPYLLPAVARAVRA